MYIKITNTGTTAGAGAFLGLAGGDTAIIPLGEGSTFQQDTATGRIDLVSFAAGNVPYSPSARTGAVAQFTGTQRILVEFFASNRIVASNR